MVVCHVDKGRGDTPSGGLSTHVNRDQAHTQENINAEKSHLNIHLVGDKTTKISDAVNQRLDAVKDRFKRAIRKDAVTHSRIIISGSHEKMTSLSEKELIEWSADSVQFFADRYGEENIVKAVLHRDEKTPHIHLYMTPISKKIDAKGKEYLSLSHNKIFHKVELQNLQTDFAKSVGKKYGFERGINNSPRKHISTRDFYKLLEKTDLDVKDVVQNMSREELQELVIANHFESLSPEEKEKIINKNLKNGREQKTAEPTRTNEPAEERSREKRDKPRTRDNGFSR